MKVAVIDLKDTVDSYYKNNNVYDIVLSSPIGFEEDDFDSLKELVDSVIYKVKKSRNKHDINNIEKYINIDLDELNSLKAEVDNYVAQLHIMDEPDNFDIIENCELIETIHSADLQ